jgi:hypothetical protein
MFSFSHKLCPTLAKSIHFLLRFNDVLKRYLRKEKTARVISYRDSHLSALRVDGRPMKQDIRRSAFEMAVYIQFSLTISFLIIDSRAMGSISTNHGDGQIGINSVKD